MDLKQLAALAAVADHGSFTEAARALFTVQSNVSAHVANLEKELGLALVDRDTMQPTAAGQAVLLRARRIQHELDALTADVASLGNEVAGDARLGVIGTTGRWLMPRVLTELRRRHPHVHSTIIEGSSSSLIPLLLSGGADLAIANLRRTDPDLVIEPLFDEELLLLVSGTHPLADRVTVELEELAGLPLLLTPPGTALRDELDAAARHHDVRLVPLAEIDGVRLLTSLAFEGFGPAIVPATAVPSWLRGDFHRITVPGLPRRSVGLLRRRRDLASAPARAVGDVIHAVIERIGPRQPGVRLTSPPSSVP